MKEINYKILKRIMKNAGEKISQWKNKNFWIDSKQNYWDLVTEIDLKVQDFLIESLKKEFGDIPFLAEEGDKNVKPSFDNYWILDPIDGTVNFSRGLPEFCISLAYVENDEPVLGIIYAPKMKTFYFVERGKGLYINDTKIEKIKWSDELKNSIILTGNLRGKTYRIFKYLEEKVLRIRLIGSAALSIAYVAYGYADAFISVKSNPWDVAAGFVMLKEANGEIITFEGKKANIFNKTALYTNPKIKDDLLKVYSYLTE